MTNIDIDAVNDTITVLVKRINKAVWKRVLSDSRQKLYHTYSMQSKEQQKYPFYMNDSEELRLTQILYHSAGIERSSPLLRSADLQQTSQQLRDRARMAFVAYLIEDTSERFDVRVQQLHDNVENWCDGIKNLGEPMKNGRHTTSLEFDSLIDKLMTDVFQKKPIQTPNWSYK